MTIDELMTAAKDGNAEWLTAALEDRPDLAAARAASGETPLMAALYRGHHAAVEAIVAAGAPLDVFAAAALGRIDALTAALAADPSGVTAFAYDGWTPLHLAAFFGHRDAAALLMAAGADLEARSRNSLANTSLHAAVAGGHIATALLLIETGADVNVADAGKHTPLHIAAEAGYLPVVEALLARGADAHAVDAEDRTPLARAVARQHTDVVDAINLKGPS